MKKINILYIVIPCYNEEEVIGETNKRLTTRIKLLIDNKKISPKSKILYVNDGSSDNTWNIINHIYKRNKIVEAISLSKNRGHQNALLAGLMVAKDRGDIVISIDADLQDDINVIEKMIDEYNNGFEIVYGVRNNRKKDSLFKRKTAEFFYKFMKIMGVDIVYNHADCRLASKKVLNELEKFREVNLFLRGIFPLIGYKSTIVEYEREKRYAGESKYPLKKMLSFAWDGITSFTIKPLKMIRNIGLLIVLISLIYLIYVIIGYFVGNSVSGWTTIIVLICLFGGTQILCIGIIGEYIGKIYIESKSRPRYIISEELFHR